MVASRLDSSADVPKIATYLPWTWKDISERPYPKAFSMNPSIHFDGETWRCVLRCADYGMPGGVVLRPTGVTGAHQTKNAMAILDPKDWSTISIHRMEERDDHPRHLGAMVKGYEDMRLFQTERSGLQGIAASLHLERPKQARNCPPEQVIVSFDADYHIIEAKPIRGPWSSTAQKNWVPFDGAEAPMFLYSIERGSLYDENGPIDGLPKVGLDHLGEKNRYGTEIQLRRTTQPVMAGRTLPPAYRGLRGGSQLVHISEGVWLGIGHEMRLVRDKKYYWHVWYTVNGDGQLLSMSRPMKVAGEGIEFVAGMAIDGDRVVVSYGVDDMWCRIGETSLSAVQALLAEDESELEAVREAREAPRPKPITKPIELSSDRVSRASSKATGLRARTTSAPAQSRALEARNPSIPAEVRSGPQVHIRAIPKAIDPDPIDRARPALAETRSRSLERLADGQRVPTVILSQGVVHTPLTTPATIHAQPGVSVAGTAPTRRATPTQPRALLAGTSSGTSSTSSPVATEATKVATNMSDPPALSPEDAARIEEESRRLAAAFQLRTASMDVMPPARPGTLTSGTTTSPHTTQPGAVMVGASAPTELTTEETLAKAVLERGVDYASAARRKLAPAMLIHYKAQLMIAIDVYSNLHIDEKGQAK